MAEIAEAVEMQFSLTGVKEAAAQYSQFSESSESHTAELNAAFKSLAASTQLLDAKIKSIATDSGQKMGATLQATTQHAKNAKKGVEELGESGHSLENLTEHFEIINGHLKSFTNFANLAGAAVLEIAGAEFIKEQVVELAEYGEGIERAAAKTGLSTDAVQEWNYAAKVSGTTLDALLPGFRNLTKNAVEASEGHGQLVGVFKSLNVELKDSEGHLKSTSDISNDFITALAGMEDKAKQVEIAQLAMGRSATEFLPILEQGSEGLQKMREEAHELSLVLGGEAIESAAVMREEMTKLKLVMEAGKFQAVLAFVAPLTDALQALTGALVAEQAIWKSTNTEVEDSAHSLGVFGTIVMGVVDTVEIFSLMLRQAQVGYEEFAELLGTAGAAAMETTIYYWDELMVVMNATVQTAELAWKALSHPSQAKEAIQGIGKVWQDEQKKIADLDKEHNRTEKVYWDEFQAGVDAHVSDLDNAASAVDKSLQAIRSALQNPVKAPKVEGGGSGDDVNDPKLETLKRFNEEYIRIQQQTAKAAAAANLDELEKEQAQEAADYKAKVDAFKQKYESIKGLTKNYNAALEGLEQEDKDKLTAISEAYYGKLEAERQKDLAAATKSAEAKAMAEANAIVKAQENYDKAMESLRKTEPNAALGDTGLQQSKYQTELQQIKAHFAEIQDAANDHYQKLLNYAQANGQDTTDLEQEYATKNLEIQKKEAKAKDALEMDSALASLSRTTGTLASALQAYKSFGEAYKLMAYSQVVIDTLATEQGIIKSMAGTGPWGYALGVAEAIGAGLSGLARANQIYRQKFEDGGIVAGNSRTGDNNLVRANAREMFITESQQAGLWNFIQNGSGRNSSPSSSAAPAHTIQMTYAPVFSGAPPAGKSFTDMARDNMVEFGRFFEMELRKKGLVK